MGLVFKGGWAGLDGLRTHIHARMDLKKNIDVSSWSNRRKTVEAALTSPDLFSKLELRYISRRIPFGGEDLAFCAFSWARRIGHRDRMAGLVKENGNPEQRVSFAFVFGSYKQMMKETISSAKGAYFWANIFPGDSDEFIDLVQGGKWAFQWARDVGDEQKMGSRISTSYWQLKYDKEIKDAEATFSPARNRLH